MLFTMRLRAEDVVLYREVDTVVGLKMTDMEMRTTYTPIACLEDDEHGIAELTSSDDI